MNSSLIRWINTPNLFLPRILILKMVFKGCYPCKLIRAQGRNTYHWRFVQSYILLVHLCLIAGRTRTQRYNFQPIMDYPPPFWDSLPCTCRPSIIHGKLNVQNDRLHFKMENLLLNPGNCGIYNFPGKDENKRGRSGEAQIVGDQF